MKISQLITFLGALLTLFFTAQAFAQNPQDSRAARFGIGLNFGIATNDPYKSAFGGDIRLQRDFESNVSGMLTAGYTNFSLKSGSPGKSYNVIPVKFGLKIFPVERFYISGEVGAGLGIIDGARTSFIYAPGLGIGFNNGLDLGLRYEAFNIKVYNNPSQLALRLAYGFRLSK